MAHRACGRAGSLLSRDVCPRGAALLELLPRSQAPASGAEPFCSDPVGIFISKPPNSFSEQCWEHARGLLVRRQRCQPPCPLPPAVGAAARGNAACPAGPGPPALPPGSRAQDLSRYPAALFSLQPPPCQGWDFAAGARAAVGTAWHLPGIVTSPGSCTLQVSLWGAGVLPA